MAHRKAEQHQTFADVVREVKAVPRPPASDERDALRPIEGGSWRTADRVAWRLHRHVSSAGTVHELLSGPGTRVLWVDGADAQELLASDAMSKWEAVESDFKQQYRRAGQPELQIDVAEFQDETGRVLIIVEVAC